ncbi:RNA polymerase sigma factor [Micromonospora cathayae]|uniref:Sigma-70 family RNA polymerase sigma factor n=1 Tax=Micromonospora cathayae TaxID=3028804 RepID=A0ABY7ZZ32_9ACTN|nr:sigma-70 family RNA polymerase sigma factor [Micromonospora sp. HUAS 3]WDZ88155.1 sigma-70 family RNA polymerase sigma factor [Micromonospora sp. HUAS 3]
MLAATVRVARDLDLAEECVQEAYVAALSAWADGLPDNPGAWLTATARRKVLDAIRREQRFRSKMHLLVEPDVTETEEPEEHVFRDDRLRLVFTCCHPALAKEAQIALTLRLICGMSTADISRMFLVSETTMAARVTRAKKKIMAARIPYRVPPPEELPDRLDAVLTVIYLLYTTGHTAPSGGQLVREDLVDAAMHLARMLVELMPDEREVRGLLALMLVTDARRLTRTDAEGRLLLLEEQDRSLWDLAAIEEGCRLVAEALRGGSPGRFTVQAAIAAEYVRAPTFAETDWERILAFYNYLLTLWPSPVVALNRAVALAMRSGPAAGLGEVERLESTGQLAGYRYLAATKADLLRRVGRHAEAVSTYQKAVQLADNDAERAFLVARMAESARH